MAGHKPSPKLSSFSKPTPRSLTGGGFPARSVAFLREKAFVPVGPVGAKPAKGVDREWGWGDENVGSKSTAN